MAGEGWLRKPTSLKFTTAAWTHPVAVPGLEARRSHKGPQMSHSPKPETLRLLGAFCPVHQGLEAGGSQPDTESSPLKICLGSRHKVFKSDCHSLSLVKVLKTSRLTAALFKIRLKLCKDRHGRRMPANTQGSPGT